jgi:hypothetical protein
MPQQQASAVMNYWRGQTEHPNHRLRVVADIRPTAATIGDSMTPCQVPQRHYNAKADDDRQAPAATCDPSLSDKHLRPSTQVD